MAEHITEDRANASEIARDYRVDHRPDYSPPSGLPNPTPIEDRGTHAKGMYVFNRRIARERSQREAGR